MNRVKGVVKWFNDAKGFGFVETESHAGDIFIHYSQIVTDGFKTLTEGATIEFDLVVGAKGATAYNAVKIHEGLPKDEDECDHYDNEDGTCLQCGNDLSEHLIAKADHHFNW